jgi:hypothetical protein
VGIAEVKLGDLAGRGPKAGLDQLAMAGGREYLGTYTAKFLIVARKQQPGILTLARERGIDVIELPRPDDAQPLTRVQADMLAARIRARLSA